MTGGLSIVEAGNALRDRRITAVALAQQALERIKTRNSDVDAFITVTEQRALADAARADAELAAGIDRGPMHGIPYGLKDIYDSAGIRTTCHSKLLLDRVPRDDSVVAARLASAGGVLLGKLATHEFAIGGPSLDLPFPPARNPWNREHVPGGSSSGSAAAVAAGMLRVAMGSDTASSIRGPAAYCGIVGLKPSYGRVSRRGVHPLAYSLDHCGPLAASVEDAAIALQVIAGHDPQDPGSTDLPVPDYRAGLHAGVAGLRIGLPRQFYAGAGDFAAETIAAIDAVADRLRQAGAMVEEVTLPAYEIFNACGRVILAVEAFAVHEQDLRRRPLDYAETTFLRLVGGASLTGADYVQAQRVRRTLIAHVNDVLQHCDALITAGVLTPAARFVDSFAPSAPAWPTQTIQFNVTGHPAMAVPTGLSAAGLPLSLQVVGRPFDEAMVLRVGQAIEDSGPALPRA